MKRRDSAKVKQRPRVRLRECWVWWIHEVDSPCIAYGGPQYVAAYVSQRTRKPRRLEPVSESLSGRWVLMREVKRAK